MFFFFCFSDISFSVDWFLNGSRTYLLFLVTKLYTFSNACATKNKHSYPYIESIVWAHQIKTKTKNVIVNRSFFLLSFLFGIFVSFIHKKKKNIVFQNISCVDYFFLIWFLFFIYSLIVNSHTESILCVNVKHLNVSSVCFGWCVSKSSIDHLFCLNMNCFSYIFFTSSLLSKLLLLLLSLVFFKLTFFDLPF